MKNIENCRSAALLFGITLATGTTAVLLGKGSWQLGKGVVNVSKWTGNNALWGIDKVENQAARLLDFCIEKAQKTAFSINEKIPLAGRVASRFSWAGQKIAIPLSYIFNHAPSLRDPIYAALGAGISASICDSKVFDRELTPKTKLLADLFVITVGTRIFAPLLARGFSAHVITRGDALKWGAAFGVMKGLYTVYGPKKINEDSNYEVDKW